MPPIDFTTAFGRLLQDGSLRDELAANPTLVATKLQLRVSDHAAVMGLDVADLECQAQVLLRKRLTAVRRVLPRTCQQLGDRTWPLFLKYARSFWPQETPLAAADAYGFCSSLGSTGLKIVDAQERNRLQFLFSRNAAAVHLVNSEPGLVTIKLQLLFRFGPTRWREILLYGKL